MKKLFIFGLCVLLALSMALSSCDFAGLFDGETSETVNTTETPTTETPTTETPTTENTTPVEEPPQNTPAQSDEELYNNALTLLGDGNIEDAYAIFLTIKEYADVSDYLSRFSYKYTTEILTYLQSSTDLSQVSTTVYNQYGNPLFDVSYYPVSGYIYAYYFEYDENQNLISKTSKSDDWEYETLYKYDAYNRPIWRSSPDGIAKIEYDDKGNVIKRVASYGAMYEYEYDSNNNLLKSTYTDERGNLVSTETFAYDAKGQLIRKTYEDNDFEYPLSIVYTYTYDENGNLLVDDRVTSSGYHTRDEYTYDAGGAPIKKTEYTPHGTYYYVWEYDKAGNEILEKRSFADGTRDYMYSQIYDEAGNRIKTHYQYGVSDEVVGETFYEYDEHGNLLKVTSQYSVTEYSGYKLYYNPYSNPSVEFLDNSIGK